MAIETVGVLGCGTMGSGISEVCARNGYTVVFDTSAQGSPVVYGSSQIDVTQEIVRLYDQAYPIKGGTAAPSSSAPPAAQPKAPAPDLKFRACVWL